MAFNVTLEIIDDVATITLSGELDRQVASLFQEQVEKAAAQDLKKLILMMQDLEYMASAGLRVLIFAKQKLGNSVDIYVVGAQEMVADTIEKTGFSHSIYMLDKL